MAERTLIEVLLLRYEELRAQQAEITLDELCRDCPELLGELEERIRDLKAVDAWLNREPGPCGAGGPAAPAALATETRYRILRRFAQGGLGEVLLAEDERLRRPVALKRLHGPHAHNPYSRRRFAREAEVTSRLEHPNIVPVHTAGQDPQGQPFYTMRFIEGQTLDEAIRLFYRARADRPGRDPAERRLALRQLLGRFVAVCNTVAYAHSRGVVHRDIKPSNVMLGPYGETLLVDWGLAKTLAAPDSASDWGAPPAAAPDAGAAETQAGTVLGTPAYMSPEQAEGHIDQVGPASDVYGLGATLYAVLTGQAPYQGREMAAVVEAVKRGELPAPRHVRREVPRALEAICLKAMARQPAQRYATALELAADVERWLAGDPVSAWREPWLVRGRRWLSRRRTLVAVVISAILVGALGLALATWSLRAANAELAALNARAKPHGAPKGTWRRRRSCF